MSSEKKYITLKSSDNEEFVVEESVAVMSITIKNMVEDRCTSSVIPVPAVDGKTMAKVIEYCKKHVEEIDHVVLKEFDKNFMDIDLNDLYHLLMAANFLDIKILLERVIDKVADIIKGKSSEEIRKIFGIENDLSEEENEEIRRENSWVRSDIK